MYVYFCFKISEIISIARLLSAVLFLPGVNMACGSLDEAPQCAAHACVPGSPRPAGVRGAATRAPVTPQSPWQHTCTGAPAWRWCLQTGTGHIFTTTVNFNKINL